MRSDVSRSHAPRMLCALTAVALLGLLLGCSGKNGPAGAAQAGMTAQELAAMPKIDAHTHVRGLSAAEESALMTELDKQNMSWLTISTAAMHWESLKKQIESGIYMHEKYPQQIAWATSFNLENWGKPDWEQSAIETIRDGFAKGAVAVKVWKDIGMVLKDPDSSFVMVDDPRFDPIFNYVESQNKTLVAHIGEPRNCWLPLDSMTVNNDRKYFAEFPEYHAYLHPQIPHYWKQIASRDSVLAHHPNLRVVGCHLGSLEFDVDELARRFDMYPNFAVDMAARVCHFQVQDREKVRSFLIKYQDRVLYGTDLGAGYDYMKTGMDSTLMKIEETYTKDYEYFATDKEMQVWEVDGKFRGLALPADVLKKIFCDNAKKWYPGM
jgi:predicted TIM-barrel fold metal-dependent hydrolase